MLGRQFADEWEVVRDKWADWHNEPLRVLALKRCKRAMPRLRCICVLDQENAP